MNLFRFQKRAIRELLIETLVNKNKEVILKSPTGSGKTIILSKYVKCVDELITYGNSSPCLSELEFSDSQLLKFDFEDICKRFWNNEYVWLSPSTGGLAKQSKESYENNFNSESNSLYDFIYSSNEDNYITFIGMSSISSDSNIVRRQTENINWNDAIKRKNNLGKTFSVIIDESHIGDTESRELLLKELNPNLVVYASATPIIKKDSVVVEVIDEEVIEEGLITKAIKINKNLPNSDENQDQEIKILINVGLKKQEEIRNKYIELYNNGDSKKLVNPLIIIQYPNKDYGDELFETVNDYLLKKGLQDNEIAKWMTVSGKEIKENLDNITDDNDKVIVLHMKQAISTGWDCPRAKILIKLRDRGSETFETQVIGRIRRMPERKHYNINILDNSYIYTYDNHWISKGEEQGVFLREKNIKLKSEIKRIKLQKEIRNRDTKNISSKELREIIEKHFIQKYRLTNDNFELNKQILENNGYIFRKYTYTEVATGEAKNTEKIKESIEIQKRRRVVNKESMSLKRSFEKINSKIKLNDLPTTKIIIKKLFQSNENPMSRDYSGYLLNLGPREFRQFIVNNEKKLYLDISDALQKKQNQEYQRNIANISTETISIPESYEIKINTRITNASEYEKSAYMGMTTDIHGSIVEKKFDAFIDKLNATEWWMKSADVGEEFLSIVYITIIGKQYQFYPDYICKINGEIWVIETKGGIDTNGQNENIDSQAENKFYALKDWANKNNLKFGFVRYSKLHDQLFISNTEYEELMEIDSFLCPWVEINKILGENNEVL